MGQQIHNAYKIVDAIPRFKVKEFRDVPGVRPDFVDFTTHTIYELKPINPRAVADGLKQLARYKEVFERYYPGQTWATKLDTYWKYEYKRVTNIF
ncbi:MAG: hypothetical protein HYV28_12040 [Ignavibacteriales bacterium]|nr:hypothetical protein [Ignavibacteriales bacterium]